MTPSSDACTRPTPVATVASSAWHWACEPTLEALELQADGGLGRARRLRRAGEAAQIGNEDKGRNGIEIERTHRL